MEDANTIVLDWSNLSHMPFIGIRLRRCIRLERVEKANQGMSWLTEVLLGNGAIKVVCACVYFKQKTLTVYCYCQNYVAYSKRIFVHHFKFKLYCHERKSRDP